MITLLLASLTWNKEGILLTSCAGGMRTDCHIPVTRETDQGGIFLKVSVVYDDHIVARIPHMEQSPVLGKTGKITAYSVKVPRTATDEEVGMEGATAIDLSMLCAKRMLNIDSEEEGILLTSCAGGMRTDSG